MATLLPNGKQQFLDASGNPLVGGKVYFFVPGGTTPKDTWQDAAQETLNSNPVILDGRGQAVIYGVGAYRQVVYDALGNLIWDQTTSDTANGGSGSGGVTYQAPYTGTVSLTLNTKLGETVSVLDFGADNSGVNDSTAAFSQALSSYNSIHVPSGVYKISNTINVTKDGTSLRGDGIDATFLQFTSNSAVGIAVTSGLSQVCLRDFTLFRPDVSGAAPAATANGLTVDTVGDCQLLNIRAVGHANGIVVSSCAGFGRISGCISSNNSTHGFLLIGVASMSGMHWAISDCRSTNNDGYGYAAVVQGGQSPQYMVPWSNLSTSGNTLGGVYINGVNGGPINGFQLTGGQLYADGGHGITLDTYGGQHIITGVDIAFCGTSPTGRLGTTPSSGNGNGIYATTNNVDVTVTGCVVTSVCQHGIQMRSQDALVADCRVTQFGLIAGNTYQGIVYDVEQTSGLISGCRVGSTTGSAGIWLFDGNNATVTGCDLRYNTFGIAVPNNFANLRISNCLGYNTVNAGSVTIPANTRSVTVAHTLPGIPAFIAVTSNGDPSVNALFADTIDGTNFHISLATPLSYDLFVSWRASLTRFS